jgi:hypothetical protein
VRHRDWNRFSATLVAVVIIIALALVVNPELRALLLLTDYLGLDLFTLLALMQLKTLRYVSFPAAAKTSDSLCALAFCVGSRAMLTYPKALAWRPFDKLVCPALVFITYGVTCRVPNP